jgi:hypothetical protein
VTEVHETHGWGWEELCLLCFRVRCHSDGRMSSARALGIEKNYLFSACVYANTPFVKMFVVWTTLSAGCHDERSIVASAEESSHHKT